MRLDLLETRLPNGVRVVTAEMAHVASVALGFWVGTGGRHEAAGVSGVSHFIEHLLFKGTRTRTAREISQEIEGRGGYFNAFTQEESTCFYARISSEYLSPVLEILADMYWNPRLAPADIKKERGVIIEEIMMYRDQPQQLVQEMLGELLWKGHALGRPLIGTTRTIERMSRTDILTYKERHYIPRNTLVVFAGRVRHEDCVRLVRERWGVDSRRTKSAFAPVTPRTPQAPVRSVSREIEQTHMALGFRVFGRNDERKYTLKLMSIVLGENMSSRLFQVVREKHGLAYSIHSSADLLAETGVLGIQAGVDRKRTIKALDLIGQELRRLKDRPVGGSELRRAKDYAIGQLKIGLESTTNQMMWAGENILNYNRFVQPAEVIDRLESVSASDIRSLAGEVLASRRLSAALVTPREEPVAGDAVQACFATL